jgi:predicted permease
MNALVSDIRFALRTLRRRPGFVLAIVVTLGLGIGANTAVFSLVNTVILHPLAVHEPDRLVAIYSGRRGMPYASSTFAFYRELAEHNSTLAGTSAYWHSKLPLGDNARPQEINVALVTDNYFNVLGVRAALGRTMLPGDPKSAGANPVVVLSDALWRSRFGADPSVIGTQIHIKGQPVTVIGVAPDRFQGTDLTMVPDLWMPVSMVPLLKMEMMSQPGGVNPDMPFFDIFARLAPGVDPRQAAADITTIARHADISSPLSGLRPGELPTISVVPITEAAAAIRNRTPLLRFVQLLAGVVALTLLLACLNIANLLVVRAGEQARELGVRAALGARARRLAQQLFTESFILALIGGCIGIAVAVVMLRVFSTFTLPGGVALDRVNLGLNPAVLAFTCGMSLITALGFGLAPAIRASRVYANEVIRNRDGTLPVLRRRGALLAIQVAISLVLLVGAGLLLRSIRAGFETDIGFDPHPLAAVTTVMRYDGTREGNTRDYMAIVTEMEHTSGVSHAAVATHVPLAPATERAFAAGADSATGGGQTVIMGVNQIAGDYFKTLDDPLVMGRSFTSQDGPTAPHVLILNESAAQALWPGQSPLGRLVHYSWMGAVTFTYTVVGVVRDTKYSSLQDQRVPFAYMPIAQEDIPSSTITFLARSSQPRATLATLRRTVTAIAPDLKSPDLSGLRPRLVSEQIDMLLAPQRLGAILLSGFAIIALCISAVGIYGTVAYATSRRTTEIGIRMALGAQSMDVLRLILSETGAAVAVGIGLGVASAALMTKLLTQWLYNVVPLDPLSFVAAVTIVAFMAITASLVPSLRAVRINPVQAIRTLE